MALINPRAARYGAGDTSGLYQLANVLHSLAQHRDEENTKAEMLKALPAKIRAFAGGLSSRELGSLLVRMKLGQRQLRDRTSAASDLESQRQQGREKIQEMRSTGKAPKPPKADDAELLIEQLKATGEADDAAIANEIDAYRKTGKGDPHDILSRATKAIQPKVKGMGLGNPFYSTSLMKRIATALAQQPAAQETPPPAPPGGEAGGAGVPRGTAAAPADPEHAAAEAAKAAGYSRDDVVKHLQATGATPEQLKAVDEVYGIEKPGLFTRLVRGAQGGWANAAAARGEAPLSGMPAAKYALNSAIDAAGLAAPEASVARGIPQVMDPLLKHLLPGWQGPGDSIMPHDVSVTPLPQGNDLAGMPTNDLTRGGFSADVERKQSLLQLGQLLKALTGVP